MEERKILEEIRLYHEERIKRLKNNETPKRFYEGGKIVLHLIPIDSFRNPIDYELSVYQEQQDTLLKPMLTEKIGYSQIYNFDGVLVFSLASDQTCLSYVQLYTNGMIEAVEGFYLTREEKEIPIYSIEQEIILKTACYLSLQQQMGIEPPVVCYLALLGVREYWIMDRSIDTHFLDIHSFDRDDLILPVLKIDKFDIDTTKLLKINFDRIWNACGYPGSFQYDEKGEFKAKY